MVLQPRRGDRPRRPDGSRTAAAALLPCPHPAPRCRGRPAAARVAGGAGLGGRGRGFRPRGGGWRAVLVAGDRRVGCSPPQRVLSRRLRGWGDAALSAAAIVAAASRRPARWWATRPA